MRALLLKMSILHLSNLVQAESEVLRIPALRLYLTDGTHSPKANFNLRGFADIAS